MNSLKDKVAVVTGASKGIGAGIAKQFAAAGAAVVANYASDKAGAERVVAEIVAADGRALAVQADVSKGADAKRLFEQAVAGFGPIDVLVNNAGVFTFASLADSTEADWRRQFDTNVLGTLLATQEAVKHFNPAGGSIVNITSIASVAAMPDSVVYAASKSAVDAMTRVLALELAPKAIRVNAIAPGMTVTEGLASMGVSGAEAEKQMATAVPLGRLGRPDDIAKLAVFLASDDAAWITGERVTASGGQR